MIKMIVKHEVAVEEREHWMTEFENKKAHSRSIWDLTRH